MDFRAPILVLAAALCASAPGVAADLKIIQDTAEQHVRLQIRGMTGTPTVTIGKIDVSRLPACQVHEAFTPQGSNLLGKTLVGVRCLAPSSWVVLIPAQIAVSGNYVTASRPLVAGQIIGQGDLSVITGNTATLPTGAIGDPAQAIGKTLRNSLGAGQPIRANQLQEPLVIRQGQSVRVVSKGEGFSASAEGRALANATVGQPVQVRMGSGQTISGTAKDDGSVEILF